MSEDEFLDLVRAALRNDREKDLEPRATMISLSERIGGLAIAVIQATEFAPMRYIPGQVVYAAVKVAAMAARVATEGDQSVKLIDAMTSGDGTRQP